MSTFQQRLYDHEVDPPTSAWDRIAGALDQERIYDFQQTLYDSSATPPPAVWDRIASALDADGKQPAMPIPQAKGRVTPMFIRYAVAAALIGFVATFAFYFFNRTPGNSTLSENNTAPPASAPAAAQAPAGGSVTPEGKPATDFSATVTAASSGPDKRVRTVSAGRRTNAPLPSASSQDYQDPLYAYEDHVPDMAERYVMLMTPDGAFIRMSKKLGPLVCCVTGQDQDEQCRSQIRKLQQELATAPVGTGNVMDVLGIVNSLDNGTQL